MKLLRRNPKTSASESVEPEDEVTVEGAPANYTPGKGRPTPKRRDSQVRRGPVAPPPQTRREAYKRMRAKTGDRRSEVRKAMASGDERYMTKRDKGPARALARDLVDSRRNIGSIFMLVALLVLATYAAPQAIRTWAMSIVLVLFLVIAVDSFSLSRRIRKIVTERYPDEDTRGVGWYGVQRSMMIRRWRLPKVRVKIGEKV